jgi:hypothetical protein
MAILYLVDGKKGVGDILVLVTSYEQPLTFAEWLFIGKQYLDSEDTYYPVSAGYIGKAMLLNALNELACGVPFDKVLEHYGLLRKRSLNVIDKRRDPDKSPSISQTSPIGLSQKRRTIEGLHEVIE